MHYLDLRRRKLMNCTHARSGRDPANLSPPPNRHPVILTCSKGQLTHVLEVTPTLNRFNLTFWTGFDSLLQCASTSDFMRFYSSSGKNPLRAPTTTELSVLQELYREA
ncbi:unnamed protein product [Enterobius vermicularis]|uniref:Uncharacterized protein n=1 Tax=Enterobius vermicularis TaxID=51028 RepID=A0A0N4UZJ9_ENTVE|nr:unnamed protein product [Enterobius vermicularis]